MTKLVRQPSAGMRIAVIGGGLIGLSIAWRLAQRGVDVSLYERGELGRGASFAAAGMLSVIAEAEPSDPRFFELCRESRRRWPEFAAELEAVGGFQVDLRERGTLLVARNAREEEDLAGLARAHDGDGTLLRLETNQWRRLEPGLNPGVHAVYLAPEDGQVDNRAVLQMLAKTAAAAGVRLRCNTQVMRLIATAGRISGLETAAERMAFDAVVLATAIGTDTLLAASGLEAAVPPIVPVKGQMLAVQMGSPIVRHVIRSGAGPYLVPRSSGRLIVGATSEPGIEDAALTDAARSALRDGMIGLVPDTANLTIVDQWSGLRPRLPSGLPLIGPAGTGGLLVAIGHYRNGVLLTPITADLIANALTDRLTNRECDLLAAFAPKPESTERASRSQLARP